MVTQPLSPDRQSSDTQVDLVVSPFVIAIAALVGLLAGVGVALYLQTLSIDIATSHAAIALAAAGAVYAGSGLSSHLKASAALEMAIALTFILVAALGAIHSPRALAIGFFAHALWDVLHHVRLVPTPIQRWYPPLCAAFDVAVGCGLWLLTRSV